MPTIKHKLVGTVSYKVLPKSKNGTIPLDMEDGWESQNITRVFIPQLVGVEDGTANGSDGWIKWHKDFAHQLKGAFAEIEAKGLKHLIRSFAGSYYPRIIRGAEETPSEHSFGTALDINAAWNGLGVNPPAAGKPGSVRQLVAIFERWGFRWGGNFKRRDGMHFEIARKVAGAQVGIVAPAKSVSSAPRFEPVTAVLNGRKLTETFYADGTLYAPVRQVVGAVGLGLDVEGTREAGYKLQTVK